MMEIQSLPTKVSTPPDVRRNQQEKIQYLNKVIGSFVDSSCLALPNVKNAIEKQREQQQQACVQNNNIVSVQSNNILPGIIYLLLDARVDYLSQIYLFNLSVVLGLKTKGAYHLLELKGPKELVLIGVNGKFKAGPCDYSHDPCVKYTKELM